MSEKENLALLETFWRDLYAKNFEKVGAYFTEDGRYEDVCTPDPGAVGPANITTRLGIGLGPIESCSNEHHRAAANGDTVFTEHTEKWHFHTGEVSVLEVVSVHVFENDKIKLWRDYWDLGALMSTAPAWWIEGLAKHGDLELA